MNALLGDESLAVENENGVELRVLLGAQVGSCLTLSVGEYFLGCSDECAIILAGQKIAPRHALLRFDGETAWIEPFEGKVLGKHGDDIDGEQELELGAPVRLGNVVIAVDYGEAPWPELESVAFSNYFDKQEEQEDQEEQDESDSELSNEEPASEQEEGQVTISTAANPGRSGRGTLQGKTKWLLILLLTAGIGIIAGMVWMNADDKEKDHTTATATEEVPRVDQPPAAAMAVLKEYSDDALMIKKENGRWEVGGYVSTSARGTSLAEALATAAPEVHVSVFAENALTQSIKNLLDSENLDAFIRVESVTQGVARLSGAAASSSETERIVQLVKEKVPGILEVKANLLLPDQLRKMMRARIASAGLGDRLVIAGDGQDLKLTGRLTQEEIRRWEEMVVGFTKEFGNVLRINATITRVVPKPPIGVQVIVGGAMPYIVTESGEHVNQGGNVDGHTLMSIKEGEVVFEGSQRIRIAR